MSKFSSPLEAFLSWEKQIPNQIFLKQPINDKVISYSYAEAGQEARKIASALRNFGLKKGDHVALLSKNCAHWIMADLAIMMGGFVSIPIYPSLNDASILQILEHSDSKAIIVGKLDYFESQKLGIPDIPKISVASYGIQYGESWENLVLSHSPLALANLPKPDDLYTIIYTSGTTGIPKGAMHTVNNFCVSLNTLCEFLKIPTGVEILSFLPLAHVAERVFCTGCIVVGGQISFSESLATFAKDLERTQPRYFFAVPRIWTKFQEKILAAVPQKKLNILLKIPILNTLIKNKLKQKLGLKNAIFIASAAAPISPSLVQWFGTIGIIIYQGYGMTEDCCVSHFNKPGHNKIGTVGTILPGVKVKLSPEGEICIKNDCLLKGYYKAPELTATIFDEEGYFKTGDTGEYDHDGYLTITGRVKDQFKTNKGKYVLPSHIELLMSQNEHIGQVCVVGTGIPQPIALVTLSESGKLVSLEDLTQSLTETIRAVNPKLENHEKLEKVVVMKEEWTVDNGLTTPTLKLKRNAIEKIHQPYYNEWFHSDEIVIFEP